MSSTRPGASRPGRRGLLLSLERWAGLDKYTGRALRQLRAALYLGLLFAASTAFYLILLLYSRAWGLGGVIAAGVLCYASPPILIRRKLVRCAKVLPALALCALVYVLGGLLGPQSNIHLALFLVIGWCMSVVDLQRERPVLGFLVGLTGVTFALVQASVTVNVGGVTPEPVMLRLMAQTMPAAVFVVFILVLAPFYKKSQVDEDRLEDSLRLLEAEVRLRAEAERGLREASVRLAEASRAKSNFIAMMGHELRTPLNGVLGVNQLLKDTPLQDEQRAMLQSIEDSGQNLLALVNDILDYVNVRSGGAHIAEIPFDVVELCEESVMSFEAQAAKQGVELDLVVDPTLPSLAAGDPSRIRQTLKELIGNALKHTHRGWVCVEVDYIVSENDHRGTFRMAVTDTGSGIAEEARGAIFEEFTQARSGASRESSGIGLGLAFCKRLMVSMGGTLDYENQPIGGSRFTFALPLRVLAQPAEKRPLAGLVFEVRGGSLRANRSLQCALRRLGGQVGGAAPEAIQLNLDDNSAIRAGDDVPVRSETRRSVRQLVVRRRVLRELQTMLGELVPPSSRTGGRPLHALVVEDNVVNQKVLSKLLENLGVSVTCVANGALAVSAWKQHPLDVIFMDVEMPVMNGLDATIAIRAMPGGIEIPIVGVSANATPEEQQRGLEAGMNCYLQKPIRKEQVSKVLRALYRNQPLSAHLASI